MAPIWLLKLLLLATIVLRYNVVVVLTSSYRQAALEGERQKLNMPGENNISPLHLYTQTLTNECDRERQSQKEMERESLLCSESRP